MQCIHQNLKAKFSPFRRIRGEDVHIGPSRFKQIVLMSSEMKRRKLKSGVWRSYHDLKISFLSLIATQIGLYTSTTSCYFTHSMSAASVNTKLCVKCRDIKGAAAKEFMRLFFLISWLSRALDIPSSF